MKGLLSLGIFVGFCSIIAGVGLTTGMAIGEEISDKIHVSECKRKLKEMAKKQAEALKNDKTEIES